MAQNDVILHQNTASTGEEISEKRVTLVRGGLITGDASSYPKILLPGIAGQVLSTNASNDLEWTSSGSPTFLGLTDTPSSYVGSGLYITRVNSDETGIEFIRYGEYTSRTINLDNTMTTAQIQSAIDSVGKYIHDGVTITFQFANGTYNLTGTLNFKGFWGGGTIRIYGNAADNTASSTKQVVLQNSGTVINVSGVRTSVIEIKYLKVVQTSTSGSNTDCFFIYSTTADVQIFYCSAQQNNIDRYNYYFLVCVLGRVYYSYAQGGYAAIRSFGSRVLSYTNYSVSAGELPQYGLHATVAGVIGKSGAQQPTGSTANEYANDGGVIR